MPLARNNFVSIYMSAILISHNKTFNDNDVIYEDNNKFILSLVTKILIAIIKLQLFNLIRIICLLDLNYTFEIEVMLEFQLFIVQKCFEFLFTSGISFCISSG